MRTSKSPSVFFVYLGRTCVARIIASAEEDAIRQAVRSVGWLAAYAPALEARREPKPPIPDAAYEAYLATPYD